MKLLATIYDSDDLDKQSKRLSKSCSRRNAARAVLIDADSRVALMHVTKWGYHKLPGGGIDRGESVAGALARELQEETGCKAEVIQEIGRTDEYWNEEDLFQQSFCYFAKVIGDKGQSQFTESEINNGYELQWMDSIAEAIALLENDQPQKYSGHLIRKRDLVFLKAAQDLL